MSDMTICYISLAKVSEGLIINCVIFAVLYYSFFFFFQAEDGIRDLTVTGVQTCALPIFDIDVQGAEQVRRRVPEAILIFIMPPSREVLDARLRARNLNEPADVVQDRKSVV